MLDIIEIADGQDMKTADSAVPKAANVLSIQLESLEYAPKFGVDLAFFLESNFQFQNESFKSYLVERLTAHQINVSQVTETLETLFNQYTFFVDAADGLPGGLIR